MVSSFTEFCSQPNAGFACFDYFDRSERIGYTARIKNLLQEGASADSLKKIAKWLDDPGNQVREFYKEVDGAFLFVDTISAMRPFELCSIPDWHVSTHAMRKWYLGKDSEFSGEIDFLTDGYAIARIDRTPDYISLVAKGERAGQIFHVAHDDFGYEPMAQSFNEFIGLVMADPAKFLSDIGAMAHYSDGQTQTKWVPKQYVKDVTCFS